MRALSLSQDGAGGARGAPTAAARRPARCQGHASNSAARLAGRCGAGSVRSCRARFVCAHSVLHNPDLRARNFVPELPNHVLINEYQPGQGILAHEDGPLVRLCCDFWYGSVARSLMSAAQYTPHFAIISLSSSLLLHFYSKRTDAAPPARLFSLLLQPGSLLVVSGEGGPLHACFRRPA